MNRRLTIRLISKILSTNCGFANSEEYDFCSSYNAILIGNRLEGNE